MTTGRRLPQWLRRRLQRLLATPAGDLGPEWFSTGSTSHADRVRPVRFTNRTRFEAFCRRALEIGMPLGYELLVRFGGREHRGVDVLSVLADLPQASDTDRRDVQVHLVRIDESGIPVRELGVGVWLTPERTTVWQLAAHDDEARGLMRDLARVLDREARAYRRREAWRRPPVVDAIDSDKESDRQFASSVQLKSTLLGAGAGLLAGLLSGWLAQLLNWGQAVAPAVGPSAGPSPF